MTENNNTKISYATNNEQASPTNVPEPIGARRTSFNIDLIQPGKAEWFARHAHEMTPPVLSRHLAEYEAMLTAYENKKLPMTVIDRMQAKSIIQTLSARLDEITPKLPADLESHDRLVSDRVATRWPDDAHPTTRQIHYHFCELIFAWNMYPFRENPSTASVDEFAETIGMSRFAFASKCDADNWLEFYALEDFVEPSIDNNVAGAEFYYVTLSNRFNPNDAQHFLDVYKSSMLTLSQLQDERKRAIINDGGRVGFACIDHFASREEHVFMTIKLARMALGAGNVDK